MLNYFQTKLNKLVDMLRSTLDASMLTPSLSASSKIEASNKVGFSVPAGITCPGETEACVECYAQKAHYIYDTTQTLMVRNMLWLEQKRSEKSPRAAAFEIAKTINTSFFRPYTSGDFQEQFDVDMWEQVAKILPKVDFWFYTRSFNLDFTALAALPNVQMWISSDRFNKAKADKLYKTLAHLGVLKAYGPWNEQDQNNYYMGTGKTIPKNSFMCPVNSGKMDHLGACAKCKLCIVKGRVKKHVVFIERGAGGHSKLVNIS